MTLSFSHLGKLGRAGNMLFQIASTIGIARKNGLAPVFPNWLYDQYMAIPIQHGVMNMHQVNEGPYEYHEIPVKSGDDLVGYFQSPKYWVDSEQEVINQFEFKPSFKDFFERSAFYSRIFEKETIGIHIRRGDYVGNENYVTLPTEYYTGALKKHFPYTKKFNILIFSDDMYYAKTVLPPDEGIYFAENNADIDDLYLLTKCSHWIIANSSFSWWGAYLGNKRSGGGIIVRPTHHFAGALAERSSTKDLYPEEWIEFDHLKTDDVK